MPHFHAALRQLASNLIGTVLIVAGTVLSACLQPSASVSNPAQTSSSSSSSPAKPVAANPVPESVESVQIQPNVYFAVVAESGTCPEAIGIWEFLLGFEGGADHTVVADLSAIATAAYVSTATDHRLTYEAALADEYVTCVGTAQSDLWQMYSFRLSNGKVIFDLDLTQAGSYRDILYAGLSAERPYVHWRATE